jgi:hypothetical protein
VGRRTTRTQVEASLTMITLRRGIAIAHDQVPRQLRPAGHQILSLQPAANVVGGIECFDRDGPRTRTDLRTVSDLGCGGRGVGRGQNRLSDRRATQRVCRARGA